MKHTNTTMKYNSLFAILSLFVFGCASSAPKVVKKPQPNISRTKWEAMAFDRDLKKVKSDLPGRELNSIQQEIAAKKFSLAVKMSDKLIVSAKTRELKARAMFLRSQAFRGMGLVQPAQDVLKNLSRNFSDVDWTKQ